MKKFAVFDIDGTLIRWQLFHALANEFAKKDLLGKEGLKILKDDRAKWKNRETTDSFKEYETKLVKLFDSSIVKISPADFDKAIDSVFKEYKFQVYQYTRDLIKQLKSQGYFLLSISGSPKEIVEPIAKHYGFDDFSGSIYHRDDQGFTGKKDIVAHDKKTALEKLVKKHSLNFSRSIAVGDTHSDIPMLEMVEIPIAFNPNQQLFDHAKKQGWEIVIERKNVIYKLGKKYGKYILA